MLKHELVVRVVVDQPSSAVLKFREAVRLALVLRSLELHAPDIIRFRFTRLLGYQLWKL